jgi:hypothetical protein
MLHLKRKRVGIALAAVAVLAVAGIAVAYFTSTGSGSGSATVGSSQPLTLHGTTSGSLYPGGSTTVTFTVDNPSSGAVYLNKIHLGSVTTDAAHSSCAVSGFTMPDVTVNQSVSSGTGVSVTASGTLSMTDTGSAQDACQGAPLTLNLTSS